MKTFNELMTAVLTILPDAVIEQDEYGQLVVHTNLREDSNGELVSFGPVG